VEQLSGLDSLFLYGETPSMHMHVCGVFIFDPSTMDGGYSYERIRSLWQERLPRVPSMRQKLAIVPFKLGRPFWVNDPDFDLDRHVHRVCPESELDERSLAELVGEIDSRPLRRDRPLWEMWVVEGLPRGFIALVVKMHHSIIDGVSGTNVMAKLLDLGSDAEPQTVPHKTSKVRQPARLALLANALGRDVKGPLEVVRLLPGTAAGLGAALLRMGRASLDHVPVPPLPFTAPRTRFNATLSPRRVVAFTDISLADVKAVKDAFGVTVNDVVTAMVGGGLRKYLQVRGDLPERALLAAEPVAVHHQVTRVKSATKLSVMFATLATNVSDPLQRLQAIAEANVHAKELQRLLGADILVEWAEHFWLNAISLGTRVYSALHLADRHRVIHNLILSNVPGPPVPLYLGGARLEAVYVLGPVTDGAGLNVTVISQMDRVGIGLVSCPELVPDIWELASAIREALVELVKKIPVKRRSPKTTSAVSRPDRPKRETTRTKRAPRSA
jgi:diacylglycerol O-acyltransferase / wax synthase